MCGNSRGLNATCKPSREYVGLRLVENGTQDGCGYKPEEQDNQKYFR